MVSAIRIVLGVLDAEALSGGGTGQVARSPLVAGRTEELMYFATSRGHSSGERGALARLAIVEALLKLRSECGSPPTAAGARHSGRRVG